MPMTLNPLTRQLYYRYHRPIRRRLSHWLTRDARWWQFWRPQSGPAGAVLMTLVGSALLLGLYICLLP